MIISKFGNKSTKWEKLIILALLIGTILFAYSPIQHQIERHQIFENSTELLVEQCKIKSNFTGFNIIAINKQDFYNCIVAANDIKFKQNAFEYFKKYAEVVK